MVKNEKAICVECGKELEKHGNLQIKAGLGFCLAKYCVNKKCKRYGLVTVIWDITVYKTLSCGISEILE